MALGNARREGKHAPKPAIVEGPSSNATMRNAKLTYSDGTQAIRWSISMFPKGELSVRKRW